MGLRSHLNDGGGGGIIDCLGRLNLWTAAGTRTSVSFSVTTSCGHIQFIYGPAQTHRLCQVFLVVSI